MQKLNVLLKAYFSILFLRDYKAGIILLALSFLLPSVGILGLVAIFSSIIFAEIVSVRDEYLKHGFYLYNSLLVGMGVGYYFEVSLATVILTAILAALTFLFTFALNRVFIKYSLPILSLPFAFVGMIFYLASLKYTNLLSNILYRKPLFDISMPFEAFFKSLGTIFFLPYNIAGVIIAIVLFFYSRIMFLMAVLGFIIGVAVHTIFVPFNEALYSPYNFNFILIAISLGGVFLIAHIRNYLIALIAVAISAVLIDSMEVFLNTYSLPVYTMPFNIITILFLMLTVSIGYKYYNYNPKETPEKSLSSFLSSIYRFGGNGIKINLPFIGEWSVYQAFNGKWTHKGPWRYAYDFVIEKNGKTYKNSGEFLEDYYAFGKEVVSPINGYVVDLRADLPDNFIGNVDRINNWGNYIIISSNNGYFVEISHLMQNSINVKIGDYIQAGQIIAKCGNSGYSPQPHIHIQVQKYATLGSETIAFKFIDYIYNNRLYFNKLPKEGQNIKATTVDKSLRLYLTFILDDEFKYLNQDGQEYSFRVKMNDLGEFYFFDGKNSLYFYLDSKLFYFYDYKGDDSYLKELFKIAPKIPIVWGELEYEDSLPIELRYNSFKSALMEFLISFNYKYFAKSDIYKKEKLKVSSKYGEVHFSFYEKGFSIIKGKNFTLKRINEKDSINS